MNDMSSTTPSHLEAWYSQKPTIGLMGEFSAGKSTLLNLMLADSVLQTRVTATNMPVIWLTYAATPHAQSLSHDNVLEDFDIQDLNAQGEMGHQLIRLSLPSQILKQTDIIDTPGISDGRLSASALTFLGPYLDSVIWCSPANQAWRQTEKTMWTSMPEELREKSVLVLTRSDTLRKANDLKKVIRRCERETKDLFEKVLPVAALLAVESRENDGQIRDQANWNKSNAPAFLAEIDAIITRSAEACAARPKIELPTPVNELGVVEAVAQKQAVETVVTKQPAAIKAARKSKATSKPKVQAKPRKTSAKPVACDKVSTLKLELCQLAETSPQNGQFSEQLNHIFNAFEGDTDLSEGQRMVLSQTMSFHQTDDVLKTRVISQVTRELNDFANGPWHTLE